MWLGAFGKNVLLTLTQTHTEVGMNWRNKKGIKRELRPGWRLAGGGGWLAGWLGGISSHKFHRPRTIVTSRIWSVHS